MEADMSNDTAQATASGRSAQDLAKRAKNMAAKARIAKEIAENKSLAADFIEAIKTLINVDNLRQPNSLYVRVMEFIKAAAGKEIDDMVLYKKFKVAKTEMAKVIYTGQDNGVWIASRDEGTDTFYWFMGESKEQPKDYPGPFRRKRSSGNDETPTTNNENEEGKE